MKRIKVVKEEIRESSFIKKERELLEKNKEIDKLKKEKKKRVGRPTEKDTKNSKVTVRFSSDEMKQIKLYLKKHKIESVSKLIRLSVNEKVTQTDLFID